MANKARSEAGMGTAPLALPPVVAETTPAAAAAGNPEVKASNPEVKEGVEKAMKTAEEFVAFGQGNLEAIVKSGQIWANGLQDMGKQIAANAQAQLDETLSAFRAISGAKSVKDAFDLQTGFARAAVEKTLAESGRLTENSVKLAEQALAPLTQRWALAVEKFGSPVA